MQNLLSGVIVLRSTLAVLLSAVVGVLLLPVASELLCLLARWRRGVPARSNAELPRLLFLVPAHNEELLIASCVRSLVGLAYPASRRRIVVVADNCTDGTARLAREQGAETMERKDPGAPGKPRALAWALAQIELREWDACVIVDADSTVAPTFALGLGELAPLNDIVFQPNNWVLNEFENWLTRLGGLLGRNRFYVTYPLKQSAGLNCPISNGMGFGTNVLMRDGWRSFSITEDTELYAVYTAEGIDIRHAPAANLFSQEAHSLPQGAIQRRRWIAGRVHIIREWGPRLLRSKKISWHQKLDALVELALPAPILHLLMAVAVITAALFGIGGKPGLWIAAAAAGSLSGIVVTTIAALWNHPQPWRTFASFFMLPVYAAWRLGVMVKTVVTVRDTTWQRTGRTSAISGTMAVSDRPV
jgi:cellulose synthase/poly-beta-1,6-N-acetylglucosamine synthase-like glycosyltransferase